MYNKLFLVLFQMLDENNHLIQCIMDYQNKGKTSECSQYQQMLHTNLVYLATIADSNQNMQSLLPAASVGTELVSPQAVTVLGASVRQRLKFGAEFAAHSLQLSGPETDIFRSVQWACPFPRVLHTFPLHSRAGRAGPGDSAAELAPLFAGPASCLVGLVPPTQNLPLGPGGMNPSGAPPPPRAHNMPSDGMVGGGPPAPHMQNQMNGQMPGPNHMPMQGPGPSQLNLTSSSMSMPASSHGSMGGYSHAVPSSQSVPVQSQMTMSQGQPMGNYGPRPNMNMQPNQGPMMHQQPPSQQYNMPQGGGQHYQGQQPPMGMMGQVSQGSHMMGQRQMPPYRPPQQGPPQQYSGQEDYYADQYSHGGQGPPEGMSQQYYPDGHNDHGYQQPSYPEQGYDRPYEDSSQHYYEGGGSQYGQQQEAYQGPPPPQGYAPQQQYPGQQGYAGQQQAYGPSQGGPGPQYPNYPQGQGQQYGGYRPTQPGPPQPPQQRPYGYDQVGGGVALTGAPRARSVGPSSRPPSGPVSLCEPSQTPNDNSEDLSCGRFLGWSSGLRVTLVGTIRPVRRCGRESGVQGRGVRNSSYGARQKRRPEPSSLLVLQPLADSSR
ncbi:Protein SSXT [Myotis davidii]|uniref:Protein SSXT n=1 Tax=Myotis davidii TaxID=225400 RepID=L5LTG3_MYODS|nr:Protein SSXT [Myotis davidii]